MAEHGQRKSPKPVGCCSAEPPHLGAHLEPVAGPEDDGTAPTGSWIKFWAAPCSLFICPILQAWQVAFFRSDSFSAHAFIWADILIMQIRISLMKKKINFTTVATNTVTVLLMSLHL